MIEKSPLHQAIESQNIDKVKRLIQDKANLKEIINDVDLNQVPLDDINDEFTFVIDTDPKQMSLLDIAVTKYGPKAAPIVSALLEAKATIDAGNCSTLRSAINCGNKDIVLKLLEAKAVVNNSPGSLFGPLSDALQHHDKAIADILIDKKADCRETIGPFLVSMVHEEGGFHKVIDILLECKVDIPGSVLPKLLEKAIDRRNPLDVRALLKAKADIESKNTKLPLLMAAEQNSPHLDRMEKGFEIFQVLIAAKADTGVLKNWDPYQLMTMESEHLPKLLKLLSPWVEPTKDQWCKALETVVLKEQDSAQLEVLFKAKAPITLTKPLLKLAQDHCVDQSIIDFLENKQKIMAVLSVFFKKKKAVQLPSESSVRDEKRSSRNTLEQALLDFEKLPGFTFGEIDKQTYITPFLKSADPKAIPIIKALLTSYIESDNGDDAFDDSNRLHLKALETAASLGRLRTVEALLTPPPDRLAGSNALRNAVWNKHVKVVAKLLEHKALPNEETLEASVRDHEVLKILLEAKASTNRLIEKSITIFVGYICIGFC